MSSLVVTEVHSFGFLISGWIRKNAKKNIPKEIIRMCELFVWDFKDCFKIKNRLNKVSEWVGLVVSFLLSIGFEHLEICSEQVVESVALPKVPSSWESHRPYLAQTRRAGSWE